MLEHTVQYINVCRRPLKVFKEGSASKVMVFCSSLLATFKKEKAGGIQEGGSLPNNVLVTCVCWYRGNHPKGSYKKAKVNT